VTAPAVKAALEAIERAAVYLGDTPIPVLAAMELLEAKGLLRHWLAEVEAEHSVKA
jgi:hypothetical protein